MANKKSEIDYVEAFDKTKGGWRSYLVAIGRKNVTMLEVATLDYKVISIKKYNDMHPKSFITAEALISRIRTKMDTYDRLGVSYPEGQLENFIERIRKCLS